MFTELFTVILNGCATLEQYAVLTVIIPMYVFSAAEAGTTTESGEPVSVPAVMFVNPAATEADLNDVLVKASCTNLLARADKGLDTMIGEGGLKLSGGEKQRISIARALLRKPHLLIFDEATSALDSLTEEEITNTIRDISSEKEQITILIAHRLSTIMHADRIYVLEKGDVVETGSHEKLLVEKGLYFAMWRQQIGERKRQSLSSPTLN